MSNVEVLLQTYNDKDKRFMQYDILLARIKTIQERKRNDPTQKPWADLEDIAYTHKLSFVRATFMPFCPIAYIYNKAQKQAGDLIFGNTITYNIPINGHFIGDCVFNVQFSTAQTVDFGAPATQPKDMIRYCNLPAAKLFKKVELLLNGVTNCSFTRNNFMHFLDFELPVEKKEQWMIMLGNEKKYEGEVSPFPGFAELRRKDMYGIGAQTFKTRQDALDLYYPLIFWFNNFSNQVLANKILDKIGIRVTLDLIQNLIERQIIVVPVGAPPYPDIYPNQYGSVASSNGSVTYPTITSMDMYFKEIYVSREIYECYVKTKAFDVVSTWFEDNIPISSTNGSLPLNARDWPIERIYFSFQTDRVANNMQLWNKGYAYEHQEVSEFMSWPNPGAPPTYITETRLSTFWKEIQPIISLKVKTHSITYYDTFNSSFFNIYDPVMDNRIKKDKNGNMMLCFDFEPNNPDGLSGYASTANNVDFMLEYVSNLYSDTTPVFSPSNTGYLRVSYKIINVLLIDDKLLELRFPN